MTDAPIGIFDSGFGGLTVARAVIDQLPHEQVLYLGDTARQPYGPRPIAEVRELALESLDALVERGVKLLVIACNSASAAVLHDARERYAVPVVEVIRPAVRRAAAVTRNRVVGVISTQATATSRAYPDAFAAAPDVRVVSQACPRFVELVEAGVTSGPELLEVAHEYLDPVVDAGVDTLVLGCTHYPLLTGAIAYVMGPGRHAGVERRGDGAGGVPQRSRGRRRSVRTTPRRRSTTSSPPATPRRSRALARRFLGPEVAGAEPWQPRVAARQVGAP